MKEKMDLFFKYRSSSLLQLMGRKNYFMEFVSHRKDLSTKYKQYLKDKSLTKNPKFDRKYYFEKLVKEVNQKSKYRFRQKQDIKLSLILKSLNYDPRALSNELQEKAKLLNLYKDMEDDEDEQEDEENSKQQHQQQQVQKQHIDPNFSKLELKRFRDKQKISDNKKVLIVKGGYPALVEGFLQTGNWVLNENVESYAFDLKFTQFVNRFKNNSALTSKHGVARNLPNLISKDNFDIHKFYPRCYDLIDQVELEDFIEDFKFSKAEQLLKVMVYNEQSGKKKDFSEFEKLQVVLALNVLSRRLMGTEEKMEQIMKDKYPVISPQEWTVLNSKSEGEFQNLMQINQMEIKGNEEKNSNQNANPIFLQQVQSIIETCKKELKTIESQNQNSDSDNFKNLLKKIQETLDVLRKWDSQYNLNGIHNIWIVKPAGLSRGRGIKAFNDLEQLLFYVMGKEAQWVAQKYIENPLTINKRKFDIRQWVVVSDWDPLTLWFYDECYIRICSEEYSNESFQNPFAHLTNNSIQQRLEDYSEKADDVMMTMGDFASYLKEKENGRVVFEEIIQPRIKQGCLQTIKSAADSIQHRKNSFEMYGFDFMIDDEFNVLLIEVNSSPTMEYSTKITEKLVPQFLNDFAKLIDKYIVKEERDTMDPFKVDAGKLKCIFKQQH